MGAVEFFPFWYCSSPYYKFVPGFMRMKKRMIFTLCMDCNLQSAFESVDVSSVGISTPSFIAASVGIITPSFIAARGWRLRTVYSVQYLHANLIS